MAERSSLRDLASALAPLSADLEQFVNASLERKRKEDVLKGQAAAYRSNAEGFAEGVRRGDIPSYASPGFVAGYKGAEGTLAGIKLGQKFRAEWMAWSGKDDPDPEAFDAFLDDFLRKNITTDDPLVLAGLMPHVNQLAAGASEMFAQERHRVTYEGSLRTHMALGGQAIDHRVTEGLGSPEGIDADALYTDLMTLREAAVQSGMRAEDFDAEYVDLVTAKALEHEDPAILELLDRPVPGQSHSYADTPDGRDKKLTTEDALEKSAQRRLRDQLLLDKREDDRLEDLFTRTIHAAIFADPTAPVPEATLQAASRYIPDIRTKVVDWKKKALGGTVVDDPAAIAEVQRRVIEGGGVRAVVDAYDNNIISDPATFRTLFNFAEARDKSGGASSPVLRGSVYSGVRDAIRQRTLPPDFLAGAFDPGGMSDDGLMLLADYEMLLLEWQAANPNASLLDTRKAQSEIGTLVLSRIERGAGGSVRVTRAQGETEEQGLPTAAPGPEDDPEAATAEEEAARQMVEGALQMVEDEAERQRFEAWASSLEPAEIEAIRESARAAGTSEEEELLRLWQIRREIEDQRQGAAPAPQSDLGLAPPRGFFERLFGF